jgi:EAL domain-containing protein (putative c-di-GMP-specific phosphodiesterase class I)
VWDNVSPLLVVDGDLVDVVGEALAASGLPPSALCLELSETSLLEDAQPMLPTLETLKRIGVRLAIDDFGGGAAGFGLLRMLPFDLIKIDRVFIEGLADRPDDRAIVAAVLSLADELGLTVIAEGVEDERQHTELHELGCRHAQGFLYARPCPAEQLSLSDCSLGVQPAVSETSQIREFMRRIGGPASVEA